MVSMRATRRVAGVSSLLVFLLSLTPGCGESGAFRETGGGNNPNTGAGQFTPQFQLPGDGVTVNTVTTLSVQGSGVAAASFTVDGFVLATVTQAPFQWTLDPADFILGDYTIGIVGADIGGRTGTKEVLVSTVPCLCSRFPVGTLNRAIVFSARSV